MLKHGIPDDAVKIQSRIIDYENLPNGGGVRATLEDGTQIDPRRRANQSITVTRA
jgi:hypothetical protein